MNLKQLFLTKNACYISGKKHTVKGILVHSTGANNPKLSRYVGPDDGLLGPNQYNNHWNTAKPSGISVCVHAFIGKLADGSIATYQTLPWDMVGWHSGSGSKGSSANCNNNGYIGFEICEDGLTDATYFSKVYKEAVELCAMLCKAYGIKPESPYLICHSEGNKLGIASNHADVMHWFPKHGKSMDTFRNDVKALLGASNTTPTQTTRENDEIIWDYFIKKGFSVEGTSGLMGNLFAESGLIPTNLQNTFEKKLGMTDAQYTSAVDNGTYTNFVNDSAGYGLAQWTYYTRKQALLDFAKAEKASIGNLDMQLDFLWKELQGYTAIVNTLKSTRSILEASNIVLLQFERPADQSVAVQTKRASYGQSYYDKFAGKGSNTTAEPTINEVYQVNVTSSLNCRSGAGTSYPVVGSFKPKEIVTATKKNGGWYYVSNGKITGWSSGDYLMLLTVKGALDKLVREGIVNSPDTWLANYSKINYLDRLIINMGYADKTAKEGTDIKTAEQAIDKMVSKGLINSPDYWKTNYQNLAWLDVFLIKVANRL